MLAYRFDRILIHRDSGVDRMTSEIVGRLKGADIMTVTDVDATLVDVERTRDSRTAGKRTLVLTRYRGRFLEECPGSGAEVCCNYHVLNFASNCPSECTYCVLQSYLNNPAIVIYTNVVDMLDQVRDKLESSPARTFRIGTGELADSLALDAVTHHSSLLVPFFASLPNGILELKTKSACIENLRGLDHRGHTVVSWSVNARPVCENEELKTASLEERLEAARQCQEWGYKVGFHFDPLIWYEGWARDYEEVVQAIFQAVEPSKIAWISLGCLRFMPELRRVIINRFPRSRVPHGEFVPGHHGKLRYYRTMRQDMYARMRGWIRRHSPEAFVYLCMENCLVWERSFGLTNISTDALSDQLDSRVRPMGRS